MFKKIETTSCEYCSNYVYDEDYEYYVCDQDLDEDEMVRFDRAAECMPVFPLQ